KDKKKRGATGRARSLPHETTFPSSLLVSSSSGGPRIASAAVRTSQAPSSLGARSSVERTGTWWQRPVERGRLGQRDVAVRGESAASPALALRAAFPTPHSVLVHGGRCHPHLRSCPLHLRPRAPPRPASSPQIFLVLVREHRVRIKALMDRFVKELQKALNVDIQDRIMKEREMPATLGAQTRGRREGGRLEDRALPPRDGNFFGVVSASFRIIAMNVVG
uniref:Uncharacterized protein n=1 Tax=Triticum urartu TaxID=4572 RepID=A0A8R7UQ01_TRIUA